MMKTTIVKNRKIPTLYELGLYGYYGAISLISAVLSYPLSGYFMGNSNRKIDFCLSIFMTTISACLVFVAYIFLEIRHRKMDSRLILLQH